MKRVLIDENLPASLGRLITPNAKTVQKQGWAGKKNGELLKLAALEFDVFITMDRGIEYQQNLVDLDICIIALSATSNRLTDLIPLIEKITVAIATSRPNTLFRIAA